jgi:hypothetical protein
VLPASQTTNPPPNRNAGTSNRWRLVLIIASMVYTLGLGLGLLTGTIGAEHGYLAMALLCLAPVVWYGYGFVQVPDSKQDIGLLLSAVGWAMVALALFIKHSQGIAPPGTALDASQAQSTQSPAALVCVLVAVICMLLGAFLSWRAWAAQLRTGAGIDS